MKLNDTHFDEAQERSRHAAIAKVQRIFDSKVSDMDLYSDLHDKCSKNTLGLWLEHHNMAFKSKTKQSMIIKIVRLWNEHHDALEKEAAS